MIGTRIALVGHGRRRVTAQQRTWGGALMVVLLLVAVACVPPPEPPPLPPGILMRPQLDRGFVSMPWPNDLRVIPDGGLDLRGLPGIDVDPLEVLTGQRSIGALVLPHVVAGAGRAVSAFGVNSASFLQATVPIDPNTLPTPGQSVDPTSSVMMIDLDHGGERAPIVVETRATGNRFRPANSLIVLPYPGHPLRPATRYAVVVFDGVEGEGGVHLDPAPLIEGLDGSWSPDQGIDVDEWSALQVQRDAVRSAVADTTTHDPAGVLAFSVFTTQDVHAEMDAVAAAVDSLPTPDVQVTSNSTCVPDDRAGGAPTARVRGVVEMPRFQSGTFPYLLEGGALAIGADGAAEVRSTTPVPVALSVPCDPAPAGGWPAVAYINGTGATGDIDLSRHPFSFAGRVVAEIPPLYGGTAVADLDPLQQRLVTVLGFDDATLGGLLFFNLLNPAAGRANVLQQSANHLVLVKTLRSFQIDGTAVGGAGSIGVDPERVSVSGHSQGAQTLPLVAASDPGVAAVLSSSGSGGYYHQFAHARDKREALAMLTDDESLLDELNPLLHVAQTTLEAVDPANYPTYVDYLNVSGRADGCVSLESARHFASATGLDTAGLQDPDTLYGSASLDPPMVTLPTAGNRAGRTRINIETPGGHFVATSSPDVGTAFLDAVDAGTVPVVAADPFPSPAPAPACDGRWDTPPLRYGEL